MYKIKFKSPTVEEQILFFTATEYVIEDGLITFYRQVWQNPNLEHHLLNKH